MGFNTLKRSTLYMPPLSYALVPNFWVVLAQFSKRFIVSSLFFFSFYVYVTLQIYYIKLHMPHVAIKGTQWHDLLNYTKLE